MTRSLGALRRAGRVLFVVLDGVGVGALPDAELYGDDGVNTLGHVTAYVEVSLPHLSEMGLGLVEPLSGITPVAHPTAVVGRLSGRSPGKDSTSGHWEHMGLVLEHGFPTYPNGFPAPLIKELERSIGRRILGNKAASGTDIMEELGEEHMRSGAPIVYTSADSVWQVAAHVEVVPLEELFDICATARGLLTGPHAVGRVIARPFSGVPGAFKRTRDRRDYSVAPPGPTYLDELAARGIPVVGIGKVGDVFSDRGFSSNEKTDSNQEGMESALRAFDGMSHGLVLVNLNDFDTRYGHRNDVEGFARCLEAFDRDVHRLRSALAPGDLLVITADHGCDPTDLSFDHSREHVPLLVYPRSAILRRSRLRSGGIGVAPRATHLHVGGLSDSGATVFFHLVGERPPLKGKALQSGMRPVATPTRRRSAAAHGSPLPLARPAAAERAAAYLRARMGMPRTAVVLGSGLGEVAALLGGERVACFTDVPGWPVGRVEGHELVIEQVLLGGRAIAVLRGRVHGYEGVSRAEEEFAVRVLAALGVECVILTNACGLLRRPTGATRTAPAPSILLEVGSCAWVRRVLDLQRVATDAVAEEGGERPRPVREFPGRSSLFAGVAEEAGLIFGLPQVTYAAVPGPHYETDAEVDLLWRLGCDVVGMSAAAEVHAAACRGLQYATLTMVTNQAAERQHDGSAAHSAVIRAATRDAARMAGVVERVLSFAPLQRPKERPSPYT